MIINGDSDSILKDLVNEGKKFDLICTDPPYNLNKDFGNNSDKLKFNEFLDITEHRLKLCYDLLTDKGSIIWFGIHHYIGHIQVILYKLGFFYRRLNIWHYNNGFSRTSKTLSQQYEPFLWFSKSEKEWVYNADDVRIPYKSTDRLKNPVYYTNSKGERQKWEPNPKGALRGDIWSFPTLAGKLYKNERTKHPTQKPESLITEIIKAFCPKNSEDKYEGYILDPFHGSGTLGVCCEKLNLRGHNINWIGIELEKKWCDTGEKRLKELREREKSLLTWL